MCPRRDNDIINDQKQRRPNAKKDRQRGKAAGLDRNLDICPATLRREKFQVQRYESRSAGSSALRPMRSRPGMSSAVESACHRTHCGISDHPSCLSGSLSRRRMYGKIFTSSLFHERNTCCLSGLCRSGDACTGLSVYQLQPIFQ